VRLAELALLKNKLRMTVNSERTPKEARTILTPGQAMRLAARLQRWAMGLIRRHTPIAVLLVAGLLAGCGPTVVQYGPPVQPAAPGASCPRELTGKGHCRGHDILYCGGTKWSLIECPEGTRCEDVGDAVGCM
jgi:hypothetical protein